MQRAVSYFDYDKISDDVYYLGNFMTLRLNVSLNTTDKEGYKSSFHKEFRYDSNKYLDAVKMITMRRSFDYYLTLEKTDNKELSPMIRVQDMFLVQAKVNEALTWFNSGVFGTKRNKLYIVNKPESIIITGLVGNKSIMFDPVIIDYDEGVQTQGIRITLTETYCYSDISIDRFYGFAYIINNINMYESAQLLLNYFGRPELGTNLMEFEHSFMNQPPNESKELQSSMKPRKLNDRPKSFFDKIDDLGD